jgi:hypothetical protein
MPRDAGPFRLPLTVGPFRNFRSNPFEIGAEPQQTPAPSVAESIGDPTDAVAKSQALGRACAESVTAPTDAPSRASVGGRVIAESVSVSDAAARAVVNSRSASDSISGPVDSVARLQQALRALSESAVAPSDARVRVQAAGRGIADSVVVPSDSGARSQVLSRSLSESTSPGDSVARTFVGSRAAPESVAAPTDADARATTLLRPIAETPPAPTDSNAHQQTLLRAPSADSISLPSDAVIRPFVGFRTGSESVSFSDAIARTTVQVRTESESVVVPNDGIGRVFNGVNSVQESLPDSVALPSDAVVRSFAGVRAPSESTSPSDSVARLHTLPRAASDSVSSPSDALARVPVIGRNVVEGVPAAVSPVLGTQGARLGVIRLGAAPPAFVPLAIQKTLTSQLGIVASQLGNVQLSALPFATTPAQVSDVVARTVTNSRSISDAASAPSDSTSRLITRPKAATESISVSDAVARAVVTSRSTSQTFTAVLGTQSAMLGNLWLGSSPVVDQSGEQVSVSDFVSRTADVLARAIVESASVSDAVVAVKTFGRTRSESFSAPGDAVIRTFAGTRTFSDEFTSMLGNQHAVLGGVKLGHPPQDVRAGIPVSFAESIFPPQDGFIVHTQSNDRSISDSNGAPTDSPSALPIFGRLLFEVASAAGDALSRAFVGARSVSESVVVPIDAVAQADQAHRQYSDSVVAPSDFGVVGVQGRLHLTLRDEAMFSLERTFGPGFLAELSDEPILVLQLHNEFLSI